jgi:hypothetical protein
VVGYLTYIALTLLGVGLLFFAFTLMRKKDQTKGRRVVGALLVGPLHFNLAKRGYRLTKRELLLAALVVLLGLLAPCSAHHIHP